MTRQRVRRGVFRSIADLQATINADLAEHNASAKPFVWTRSAEALWQNSIACTVCLSQRTSRSGWWKSGGRYVLTSLTCNNP